MTIQNIIALSITLIIPILSGCMPSSAAKNPDGSPVVHTVVNAEDTTVQDPEVVIQDPVKIVEDVPSVTSACSNDHPSDAYRMGPEDTLAVVVFREADLSAPYTIDNTGMISMPLIGELSLAGCTLRQAEQIITDRYADGYLVDPSVSIEISSFRPFYILGEVKAPGKYDFASGMNVLKAAALAGGFTYRANRKTAKVLRYDHTGQAVYHHQDLEEHVHPGDVITIRERLF